MIHSIWASMATGVGAWLQRASWHSHLCHALIALELKQSPARGNYSCCIGAWFSHAVHHLTSVRVELLLLRFKGHQWYDGAASCKGYDDTSTVMALHAFASRATLLQRRKILQASPTWTSMWKTKTLSTSIWKVTMWQTIMPAWKRTTLETTTLQAIHKKDTNADSADDKDYTAADHDTGMSWARNSMPRRSPGWRQHCCLRLYQMPDNIVDTITKGHGAMDLDAWCNEPWCQGRRPQACACLPSWFWVRAPHWSCPHPWCCPWLCVPPCLPPWSTVQPPCKFIILLHLKLVLVLLLLLKLVIVTIVLLFLVFACPPSKIVLLIIYSCVSFIYLPTLENTT